MSVQAPLAFRNVQLQMSEFQSPGAAADRLVSVEVQPRALVLSDPGGIGRVLAFDQIQSIQPGPYRLDVRGMDGSRLVFSRLGLDYEAFLYQVYQAWNAYVSDALFIDESILMEAKGRYAYQAPADRLLGLPSITAADPDGSTRFRVFDNSLLVLPLRGPVIRLPLCFVDDLRREAHSIILCTRYGDHLEISWLGFDIDPLFKALSDAIRRQTGQALSLLQEAGALLPPDPGSGALQPPGPDRSALQAAAWQLRSGRGADWRMLESESPELAAWLDRLLRQWSSDGCYTTLRQLADASGGSLMIGIRREQPSDSLADPLTDSQAGAWAGARADSLTAAEAAESAESTSAASPAASAGTGDGVGAAAAADAAEKQGGPVPAFWIAAALPGRKPSLVVELISARPLAQATYVFSGPPDPADWPLYCQALNRGLEAVDFRREPIYLPLAKLQQPACQRDLSALRFCPPLSHLRATFRGRIIHRSPSSWQVALTGLLAGH